MEQKIPVLIRYGLKYNQILTRWSTNINESGILCIPDGYLQDIERDSLSQAIFFFKETHKGLDIHFFAFRDYSNYLDANGNKLSLPKLDNNGRPVTTVKTVNLVSKVTGEKLQSTKRIPVTYNPYNYIPVISERVKRLKTIDACCQWVNRFRAMNDNEQNEFIGRHRIDFENGRVTDLKVVRANYNRLMRSYRGENSVIFTSLVTSDVEEMKKDMSYLPGLYIERSVNRAFVTDEQTLKDYRSKGIRFDVIPTKVGGSHIEKHYQSKNKKNTRPNRGDSLDVRYIPTKATGVFKRLKSGKNNGVPFSQLKRDNTPLLNSQIEKQSKYWNKFK